MVIARTACLTPGERCSLYVLYRLVWMGARRPPPDPDARRPAGADRPCAAPPAQVLVEGSGARGGRHNSAHSQGCAVVDPAAQIMPAARDTPHPPRRAVPLSLRPPACRYPPFPSLSLAAPCARVPHSGRGRRPAPPPLAPQGLGGHCGHPRSPGSARRA